MNTLNDGEYVTQKVDFSPQVEYQIDKRETNPDFYQINIVNGTPRRSHQPLHRCGTIRKVFLPLL